MRGTDFVDFFVLLSPFFPIFPSDLICTTQRFDEQCSQELVANLATNNTLNFALPDSLD